MKGRQLLREAAPRILLLDSITRVEPQDAGSVVVCASHGGTSSGGFALEVPLQAVFFNDAGIGKDEAGIAALAMLQAAGVAAGAVAHTSARIGDAQDTWDHGVLSRLNARAEALGLRPGERLRDAVARLR
ncbi:MAG: hypothetical protein ACO1OY_00550 [Ramlibacter sp.]